MARLVRLSLIFFCLFAVCIPLVVGCEFLRRGKSDNAPGGIIGSRINEEAWRCLEPLILHERIEELNLGVEITGGNPIQSLN